MLIRATYRRVVPTVLLLGVSSLNNPPTTILPSACSARERTTSFVLGSYVGSTVPSELMRARPRRKLVVVVVVVLVPSALVVVVVTTGALTGWRKVKEPPITILPSDWRTMALTCRSANGL